MNFLNPANLGTVIFGLVALPFLLIAVVLIVIMLRSRRRANASKSWPTTSGRVESAYVEPRRSSSSSGGYATVYYPVVLYEYSISGRRYQSNRVRFGPEYGTSWTQPAQKTVDRYPPGTLVQVFYNPDDPTEAALEHSTGGANRVLGCVVALILGILLIAGLIMVFMQGIVTQVIQSVPKF